MDLSKFVIHFHGRNRELERASDALFDAAVELTSFTNNVELWPFIARDYPDTGTDLLAHAARASALVPAIKDLHRQLNAERTLLEAASVRHKDTVEAIAEAHPVSEDRRVGKALADQFADLETDEEEAAFREQVLGLGLAPRGPEGTQWDLDINGDSLWWTPTEPHSIDADDDAAEPDADSPWPDAAGEGHDEPFAFEGAAFDPWDSAASPAPVESAPADHDVEGAPSNPESTLAEAVSQRSSLEVPVGPGLGEPTSAAAQTNATGEVPEHRGAEAFHAGATPPRQAPGERPIPVREAVAEPAEPAQ